MTTTKARIEKLGLVPVVVIDDEAQALGTADAMAAGGVDIMEITFRTAAGAGAIEKVAKERPNILVGAGTVLSLEQCGRAIDAGAKFIVSPGFDAEVVSHCLAQDVPVYPGCVTPTEITAAIKLGLDVIKFFPANVYGGVKAIKALAGPFPNIRFIPTGGVGLANLAEYVIPEILAIGGGWLSPRGDIRDGNFEAITQICKESVEALEKARSEV
ncbi:hypothetical protein AGMMS49983_06550 [Clostridia bacterium]|nr:hypothetical protein AGMMS49983_06550 [Clostridia bacterium]